jgi:nitrogen fixation-related uncharacterized protein
MKEILLSILYVILAGIAVALTAVGIVALGWRCAKTAQSMKRRNQ